jgi:hypothetical protein
VTDMVKTHWGWLSGEGTKRLGRKKLANHNTLDSAFRFIITVLVSLSLLIAECCVCVALQIGLW